MKNSFANLSKDGLALGADASRIALKAAKYGMHISFETSKFIGDSVEEMATSFSGCKMHTGVHDKLLDEAENAVDSGFNYTLAAFERIQNKWD